MQLHSLTVLFFNISRTAATGDRRCSARGLPLEQQLLLLQPESICIRSDRDRETETTNTLALLAVELLDEEIP